MNFKLILSFLFLTVLTFSSCDRRNNYSGECPGFGLGIGDECYKSFPLTAVTVWGTVSEDCECVLPELDCPDRGQNFGDWCRDADYTLGALNEDCECEVYDCNDLPANFGDACQDSEGNEGTVNSDCECDV